MLSPHEQAAKARELAVAVTASGTDEYHSVLLSTDTLIPFIDGVVEKSGGWKAWEVNIGAIKGNGRNALDEARTPYAAKTRSGVPGSNRTLTAYDTVDTQKVSTKNFSVEELEGFLEELGIEPERVEMYNLSAAQGPRFAEFAREMHKKIQELGPSPLKLRKAA